MIEERTISYDLFESAKLKGFEDYTTHKGKIVLPTQSKLQKWLRDKYFINISIDVGQLINNWMYDIYSFKSPNTLNISMSDMIYQTYEDALEIALFETIKHI